MSFEKKAVRADAQSACHAAQACPVPCRDSTSRIGQFVATAVRNISRTVYSVSATGAGWDGLHMFAVSS